MKAIVKWLSLGLLAMVVVVAAVAGAGLVYRALAQSRAEEQLAITAPNGIDEALFVPIGGTEQWITIRGQDIANPVVLVLHGGPGMAMAPFATALLPYERRYTLVQWDQPGAAKTFRRGGSTIPSDLTIADVVDDGIDVAELVKARLEVDKLVLLGWSWGSIIGIEMARKRPDLFAVYVGTGQLAAMKAGEALVYERVLAKARQRGYPEAISELEAIGAPPYDSLDEMDTQRKWALKFAGDGTTMEALLRPLFVAPGYSLGDVMSYLRGMLDAGPHFFGSDGSAMDVDFNATATEFELPVVFVQGSEDDFTPAALAKDYLERLTAPQKAYVGIDGAGHMALIRNTDAFLAAMNEHVDPIVSTAAKASR